MADGLLDPRRIRELAAELDLRPTKQRGQNFVHDANTVRRIVAAAQLSPDDVVLEIGPGLGSLTLGLLEAAAWVHAIEIDDRLARRLPFTVAERRPGDEDRLTVIDADALRVAELPGPPPTAVVANLPYNVSVPVLLHVLATFPTIRHGLVMVQAEVADRLVAPPGSKVYGVPSVKLAWYCSARRVGSVPPAVFWPVPNVDSG
ncbi:MAG TPA: 16S rRNA (adenine(1518)-N(6)/adenine(1519)-N(6))-dimethyltransferase RsmA, partial [Micropruina sp.]|nr:16S rRNA (adenine(1518)-N(6)/adenine(1519)-N(6))-dimethyltransferase RsmA [Micropruina sp.]